jgi:tRNA(Ile)-lysidine synthase
VTTGGVDPALDAARALAVGPPSRVGVATSGGPDSLAALVLVSRVCRERGVPVTALHVQHGLRPQAAGAEREIVARAASLCGAAVDVARVDTAAARAAHGGSVEFVARELRHAALDAMALQHGLTHVVFAHHREDQVETVLLSILRGAWPGALAGMPAARPMSSGAVALRPFLSVSRSALRAHATGLGAASDPMNLDARHRRVAVRHELLPALRAVPGGVDGVVLRIAELAAMLDRAALAAASAVLQRAAREPGAVVVRADELRAAGWFARARVLRGATAADPAFGHATWGLLAALERAAAPGARIAEEVRRGVHLTGRDGMVALFTRPGSASASIAWNGCAAELPAGPGRRFRIEPLGAAPPAASPRTLLLALAPGAVVATRTRSSSDRYRLGVASHKAVADELSDRKVQAVWRARIPLLFVDGDLRWIPGIRIVPPVGGADPNVVVTLDGAAPWAPPSTEGGAGYR